MSEHLAGIDSEQARQFFKKIDTANGYKHAEEKESAYIKAAFFDAQFIHNKPLPLNKRLRDIGTDIFATISNKVLKERSEPRELIEQRNYVLLNRLKNVKRELEYEAESWKEQYNASESRLARTERKLVDLCNERDSLTSQLSEAEDAARNWKRRYNTSASRRTRIELTLADLRDGLGLLTRKLSETEEHRKRELRRRTRFFSILVLGIMVAAVVVLFAILDPDVMERGRALLFSLSQDDSASATAPFSSRIITATPRPSLTARPTRTPRPAVTPRPGATPPDTRYVIVAGEINARACPRRNCTVLRTLEPGSGVTVVEEVRGERVNAASERWALVVLPDLSRRAYVYSAFLGPEPAVPPEASATPPPTTTPRPTTTPTFTRTPRPAVTPRPGAKPPDTRYVIVAGEINARACPRRNCTVLRTLEPGSGVTVVEEVRGERVNAASERWALVVLPDLSRRAYVYSAFLGPEPVVPPEASATPPPTTTPRPASTPTITRTPRPTTTPSPTATPPDTRYVIVAGEINARACPRRNCTVLRTLEPGSGVTVVEEVRGERVNAASERWALVVLPDLSRRAYVYSAFLGPEPAVPPEASATPPPTTTPRPTTTRTPRPTTTPSPTATPSRTPNPSPTPRLLNALFDGVRARACPRRDCDILERLSVGGQATILGETQGEQVEGSTLWYRIALPNGTGGAFVHSSLLGPPTLVPPDG